MHVVIIDDGNNKQCFGPLSFEKIRQMLEDRRFKPTKDFKEIWNKEVDGETVVARIFHCRFGVAMPSYEVSGQPTK